MKQFTQTTVGPVAGALKLKIFQAVTFSIICTTMKFLPLWYISSQKTFVRLKRVLASICFINPSKLIMSPLFCWIRHKPRMTTGRRVFPSNLLGFWETLTKKCPVRNFPCSPLRISVTVLFLWNTSYNFFVLIYQPPVSFSC